MKSFLMGLTLLSSGNMTAAVVEGGILIPFLRITKVLTLHLLITLLLDFLVVDLVGERAATLVLGVDEIM